MTSFLSLENVSPEDIGKLNHDKTKNEDNLEEYQSKMDIKDNLNKVKDFFEEILKFDDNSTSIYSFDVTNKMGYIFVPFFNDTIRMLTIQIIIQFMFFMKDSDENPFLSEYFIEMIFYILLGLIFYWFIVRKILKIV
jgi:hypothetical protein